MTNITPAAETRRVRITTASVASPVLTVPLSLLVVLLPLLAVSAVPGLTVAPVDDVASSVAGAIVVSEALVVSVAFVVSVA